MTPTNQDDLSVVIDRDGAGLPPIDPRLRISALWVALVLLYAYVDIFSFYKPGTLAEIQGGTIWEFDISQLFLMLTTVFVAIPILMIPLTLSMRPKLNRNVNVVVAAIYAVVSLGNSIGEWNYYIFGSVLEAAILCVVIYWARGLVRASSGTSAPNRLG